MSVINFIIQNYQAIISGVVGMLSGMIAICLLIPGDQPEKALQSVVDMLTKISNK
jgi:hypothetical protein